MWNTILPSIFRLEVGWVPDSPGSFLLGLPSPPCPGQLLKNCCWCIFGVEGHLIFGIWSLWFHGDHHISCLCGEGFMERVLKCLLILSIPFLNSPLLRCLGSFVGGKEHVFRWPSYPFERGSHWILWRTALKLKEFGFSFGSVCPWASQFLCTSVSSSVK